MAHDFDLVVIGAGLAGLTAGATAARTGARAVVLDGHQPGGRARVTEKDGFVFNHGGHALYAGGPGMEVLRSLGVRPVGAPPPLHRYRLLAKGELHLMPSGPASLLRTTVIGSRAKAQIGRLLALLPRLAPEDFEGQSVQDWIRARELRPDAEAVLGALVRISTYTPDHAALGADAAIAQLQSAAKSGVLYLDGGWAQLIDGLARQVEVRDHEHVTGIEPDTRGVAVTTTRGRLTARAAVVAAGTPAAARALLPDAEWGDVGEPLTASCLDAAASRIPDPGYVLSLDDPLFGTTQGPPARQAPDGQAVVAAIRYGARTAAEDRAELEAFLPVTGVGAADVVHQRFLARMVVTGALPLARNGGLSGRPRVTDTGAPNVFLAGDWVGRDGLLADAAFASGRAAALAAARTAERAPSPVG